MNPITETTKYTIFIIKLARKTPSTPNPLCKEKRLNPQKTKP
jgi:hypothetical protein